MIVTPASLQIVWRREPHLTYGGFHNTADRSELLSHLNEVQICLDWLQAQEFSCRVSALSHTSYYLKHAVEFSTMRSPRDYAYVSNGAFLAAVILAGVPYRRCAGRNQPNAYVAVRSSRRNRKLWGARAEQWPCYAEYLPVQWGEEVCA